MQLTSSGPALAETAAWRWFDGLIRDQVDFTHH